MKRVFSNKTWTLFSPDEVRKLHQSYGKEFNQNYNYYEKLATSKNINNFKIVSAIKLWRKMLTMLFETGHPWITFKDPCNLRSPQQHKGIVRSSNLCTEITLNTSEKEIAVCNLGSINLSQHLTEVNEIRLDIEKLQNTLKSAIRMLDNVIDINYYSVSEAYNSNMEHRPIGLGLMGFQDSLYKMGISYDCHEAMNFADVSMEYISYFSIKYSSELAKEKGTYKSYKHSLWDKGILPIDSVKSVKEIRGKKYFKQDNTSTISWKNTTYIRYSSCWSYCNYIRISYSV
jgi:ribonucleoside-diphosphate reductase alpha chain